MITILHVVNQFDTGGMENGLVNVINNSPANQFHHIVCSLTTIGDIKKRVNPEVRYFALDKKGAERFLFLKLYKIIKRYRPDIIHIRQWGPLFDTLLGAIVYRRIKIIFSFHGMSFEEYTSQKRIKRFIRSCLLLLMDAIITLNDMMADYLSETFRIQRCRIKIIGNGVDIDRFSPRSLNKDKVSEIRNYFGIGKMDFVIGTAGRLDKIKNIRFLIDSFTLIIQNIPNAKLLIVGDGEERQDLHRIVRDAGLEQQIIFAGKNNSMHEIYPIMDIYVQTSLYEGFSNTILEAMASGLPIVCSDVGGNRTLVINNVNGYLFDIKEHHEFGQQVINLFNHPELRKIFSLKSRDIAEKRWAIESMAESYNAMYSNILKG